LWLSQEGYMENVLELYKMEQAKEVVTPLGARMRFRSATKDQLHDDEEYMNTVPYTNAVGSLMYSMICTRPDLAYPVEILSRFMGNPFKDHWLRVKWIMRYFRGSMNTKLCYRKGLEFVLKGYCDSDYATDRDKRRSISGVVFTLRGNTVSWRSRLQKVVTLSTTKAEYLAMNDAGKEALWLKGLLMDLFCYSQSAIALSKDNVYHERNMLIPSITRSVKVTKISTLINQADIFTKIVPVSKFRVAINLVRVKSE